MILSVARKTVLSAVRKVKAKGLKGSCLAFGQKISRRIASGWESVTDIAFERRLGISTAKRVTAAELGYESESHHDYGPTSYRTFLKLMRALGPPGPEDVFIDFGSGMGRVLVLAGMLPVGRVIGVELSPRLSAHAHRNIEHVRQNLRCRSIEVVTMDVTAYQVPPDATVLYFNNPFSGIVLDAVLENIRRSLIASPRRITVVANSHYAYADFETKIREHSWLKMTQEIETTGELRAWLYTNTRWTGASLFPGPARQSA
jgi:precorrin-6B methylase 2